jgi:hypothetical protein
MLGELSSYILSESANPFVWNAVGEIDTGCDAVATARAALSRFISVSLSELRELI